ncbi:MAG: 30S ribosomal protein S21 [Alphaproteobacteria bacterium]|nr:MAG: 30S ribosomal protein S21 [Alphaproteobacteria bacterium]
MLVNVYENDVDQALRALKKKMQRNGINYDMKRIRHYEKPSERKKRRKEESMRKLMKRKRQEKAFVS